MGNDVALPDSFSVRGFARYYRIGEGKVRAWIRTGELVAVNVSSSPGKPQWRITARSIEQFERRRSSAPLPKAPRRRRVPDEIDFLPDL
jgi:hypothetical protein